MNFSLIKGALEEAFFSSAKRVISSIFIFILLLSIPISVYLVNQQLTIKQQASSRFGAKPSGFPTCAWDKTSIAAGETAELIMVNYGNNFADVSTVPEPYIQPENGYKKMGKTVTGGKKYELDLPNTEYTASLLDPTSPVIDGRPNIITSCKITTSGASAPSQTAYQPKPSPQRVAGAPSPSPATGSGTTGVQTYNQIISCIRQDPLCTADVKKTADLNNDGVVNEIDLNIILRSMNSR
ncbi:MAG: hypothetical protein ACM3IJ_00780 [Candidatus Levyibacteriota bacterium]